MMDLEGGALAPEYAARHGRRVPGPWAIQEGMPADIVVYDFETSSYCRGTGRTTTPRVNGGWLARRPGYRWTLVNGEVTFADSEPTGATPGALLRHGAAEAALELSN